MGIRAGGLALALIRRQTPEILEDPPAQDFGYSKHAMISSARTGVGTPVYMLLFEVTLGDPKYDVKVAAFPPPLPPWEHIGSCWRQAYGFHGLVVTVTVAVSVAAIATTESTCSLSKACLCPSS